MLAFMQFNPMYFWSTLSILDILKMVVERVSYENLLLESKQIYFVHPKGTMSIEIKQSVVVGTILVISLRSNPFISFGHRG